MDIDSGQRDRAVDRLGTLGGLPKEAAVLRVDAVVAGAVDQAFELVNGSSAESITVRGDACWWLSDSWDYVHLN